MAYYGSNGECHLTPYLSIPYEYDDAFPAYGYCNSHQIYPELSYSVHNFTEPKLIHYSKASNSYDDTVFEEYDPTPYSGGYDIVQTYGKPLLPSKEICYPRESNGVVNALDSFDYGSIPSPSVNQLEESQKQSKDKDVKDEQKTLCDIDLDKPIGDFIVGNESIGEYGYDYGIQIPYGSGLEAVDLCESLFGYWPCLDKQNQSRKWSYAEDSGNELWKSAADYLFGYGGNGRDDIHGDFPFSDQHYYNQRQP